MPAEVVTTQLPSINLELIEMFVENDEFEDGLDFFRCAVRGMIAELTQNKLDLFSTVRVVDGDGLERMHNEMEDITQEIWTKKYAKEIY